jgi:hypothetical protein
MLDRLNVDDWVSETDDLDTVREAFNTADEALIEIIEKLRDRARRE